MEDLLKINDIESNKAKVLYETKLHWISNVVPVLMMLVGGVGIPFALLSILNGSIGVVTLFALGLSFLFFKGLYAFFLNRSIHIEVRENQLTFSSGIFSKSINDISLSKFEGLQLYQSFLGKQFGFGTLYITTGGVAHRYKIENPMKLRENILKIQNPLST